MGLGFIGSIIVGGLAGWFASMIMKADTGLFANWPRYSGRDCAELPARAAEHLRGRRLGATAGGGPCRRLSADLGLAQGTQLN